MGLTRTSFLLHYIITLHHQKGTHHKTYSPLLLLLLLLWIQIADFYITNYSLLITKQTTRIHACMQRSPYLQGQLSHMHNPQANTTHTRTHIHIFMQLLLTYMIMGGGIDTWKKKLEARVLVQPDNQISRIRSHTS